MEGDQYQCGNALHIENILISVDIAHTMQTRKLQSKLLDIHDHSQTDASVKHTLALFFHCVFLDREGTVVYFSIPLKPEHYALHAFISNASQKGRSCNDDQFMICYLNLTRYRSINEGCCSPLTLVAAILSRQIL